LVAAPNIVAVTGASGFVGSALVQELAGSSRHLCRALFRLQPASVNPLVDARVVGDLAAAEDLNEALAGVDVLIHAAARAHVLLDGETDPLEAYRHINVAGTERIASAAIAAGVRRLVYISSIGVNGKRNFDRPFTEADEPAPVDDYGRTKWEAEQKLQSFARDGSLELVILRPPLVYGPRVKGNLARLMRIIARGIPLPLASVDNQRSMIGLGNLISAIVTSAEHPATKGRTFLVSDQHDLSTPELIRLIARSLGRVPNLWPFPPRLLFAAGNLAGRRAEVERLVGSLRIDSGAFSAATEWRPQVPIDDEIARMVDASGLRR
jgi:nucleoside-diphosphate-sugar epimerase